MACLRLGVGALLCSGLVCAVVMVGTASERVEGVSVDSVSGERMLNRRGVAHHLEISPSSASRLDLPTPDAVLVGSGGRESPLWTVATVESWRAENPPHPVGVHRGRSRPPA